MARTANRRNTNNGKKERLGKVYKVGIYLRLSKEGAYNESDSIENQRRLILDFVSNHSDICIVNEYVDDGYSGINFERPAFGCMMEGIRRKELDCIIVKDLSRFGRSHLEVGDYIEKIFPFMDVRFIAVNDDYDTNDPNCSTEQMLVSLKNLLHEMYAKDMSKKIRSAFKTMRDNKQAYRRQIIPYGYQYEDGRYIIDEKSAGIVRKIFSLATEGKSKYFIANYLNDTEVSTPKGYAETKNLYQTDDRKYFWHSNVVGKIISNEFYIGTVVMNQLETDFETKKCRKKKEDDWVRIEKNHPAIVEDEIFYKANNLLKKAWDDAKSKRNENVNIKHQIILETSAYNNKIYCGDCGCRMNAMREYRQRSNEKIDFRIFQCSTYIKYRKLCSGKYLKEEDLCRVVFGAITMQLNVIKESIIIAENQQKQILSSRLNDNCKKLQSIERRKNNLKNQYTEMYCNKAEGIISNEEFLGFMESRKKELERLEKEYKNYLKEEKKIKHEQKEFEKFIKLWLKFGKEQCITEEMMEVFVQRIDVYKDKIIHITLKFDDQLQGLLTSLGKGVSA